MALNIDKCQANNFCRKILLWALQYKIDDNVIPVKTFVKDTIKDIQTESITKKTEEQWTDGCAHLRYVASVTDKLRREILHIANWTKYITRTSKWRRTRSYRKVGFGRTSIAEWPTLIWRTQNISKQYTLLSLYNKIITGYNEEYEQL